MRVRNRPGVTMHRPLVVLALLLANAAAAEEAPYAGEQARAIKSLSTKQIRALRAGAGMGLAKAAELNHYPGPKHVLELADELLLDAAQVDATRELIESVRRTASELGEAIISAESRLDHLFATGSVDAATLRSSLLTIGELRARLRYVHLEAHLEQAALMSPEQIARYDELRGYAGE